MSIFHFLNLLEIFLAILWLKICYVATDFQYTVIFKNYNLILTCNSMKETFISHIYDLVKTLSK